MKNIKIKELHRHPAHDRSTLDVEKMGGLVFGIYTQGFDPAEAVEIAQRPKGGYYIVSGNRRTIACLLAAATVAKIGTSDEFPELTLEEFTPVFTELVGDRPVFTVAETLKAEYGEVEIPCRLKEAQGANLITRLMRANAGREETDQLGRARAWEAAMKEGMSEKKIAQANGIDVKEVNETIPLAQVGEEIAFLVLMGKFSLPLAKELMKLNDEKRAGVEQFILTNKDNLSQGDVIKVIKGMKNWKGLEIPLTPKHQAQYNIALAMVNYWSMLCEKQSAIIWGLASVLVHRGVDAKPWETPDKTNAFFQVTGGDIYFDHAKQAVKWPSVLRLMKHITCETCAVSQLPSEKLEDELKLPCRQDKTVNGRCLKGIGKDGLVRLPVPESWGGLEGVEGSNGDYVVTGRDQLQAAWNAKQKAEKGGREAEAAQLEAEKAEAKKVKAKGKKQSDPPTPSSQQDDTPAGQSESQKSHVQRKREQIRFYMENHQGTNINHPWATACGSCVHKLEESPVKSAKDAPHCQWSKGGKPVGFEQLTPVAAEGQAVPAKQIIAICKQYKPEDDFVTLIPEATHPPHKQLNRQVYGLWIEELWRKVSSQCNEDRMPMTQFTGRPLANESHRD
jgi:hypothetical protein